MPATVEKSPCSEAITDAKEWYEELCKEVEYWCSFCDAAHTDIKEMEGKVKAAYAKTAKSLKGVYEMREIAKKWYAMAAFSTQVVEHARFLKQTNQICGLDLTTLLEYQKEAMYRFRVHCPEFAEHCHTAANAA